MGILQQVQSLTGRERLLIVFLLLTLPFANPWVRGDGVGYYAYLRSLLIDGDLHFENEWLAANPGFLQNRLDASGRLLPENYTATGFVHNHFTVGPALLWAPFVVPVHAGVLAANELGFHVPADGYSRPYLWTMALSTALYGFLGLWLAFRVARHYVDERWALAGAAGVWLGSSLPVYMYFNPSWSHAHSAFSVALFVWYWHRTRDSRTPLQWMALGLLGGLMVNVYYVNGLVMLIPLLELLSAYARYLRESPARWGTAAGLLAANVMFLAALLAALAPTFYTRGVIYGHPLGTGYASFDAWNWTAPVILAVLFSSLHGLFSWTPVVLLSVLGLGWLRRADAALAAGFLVVFLAFLYVIASYPTWHGISSYGNRFFVSLTPVFVIGLAVFLERAAQAMGNGRWARLAVNGGLALLVLWNAGLVFQWGTRMIPAREAVSWREVARNQFTEVPARVLQAGRRYLLERGALMRHIEEKDAVNPPGRSEP